jgi:hypothetical protein
MRSLLTILFVFSTTISLAHKQDEPDKWKLADGATVRLSPKTFHQLPNNIIRNLQARGCVTLPKNRTIEK